MTDERLGHEPRIAPLDPSEIDPGLAAMLDSMIAINAAVDSREADTLTDLADPAADRDVRAMLDRLPEIMRTMLRHPALFTCLANTGPQLLGYGALPPRDRELAILRVGWLCRAPYEWGEHVIIAKKCGVTTTEVEAVTIGSTASDWRDHDRAILRAVEELHADATISDATWATLAARYDDRQLIELPVVIGQYQAVAYYQNALRLRLHHDNPGLAAR
ncbi:carboxymuconolactone decarboxylase family protein [Sphingomonas ginsenosidivorax]|uniref:Carboxymuconolactone decarboxylase family protein n=1 Tax=Sphingomonas ginsenosidivorax TaxID=862135 RepID=A0A5C6UCW5_9SPHN|nr:carboxymuconolactone decarboxylase family protein [Sphingomonas ginsenosidivorax]TXC70240.1 carboxymuconolactone decarboxylase family protein [Sphingomonas ginsenosidivorax]